MEEFDDEAERLEMVTWQIEKRGIREPRLLAVLRTVPRHRFVPEELRRQAYDDRPLPIGSGQTISQPYIVALMTSLLQLKGDETVLEIGTGSGYQAAILACLAKTVHSVEYRPELAAQAQKTLAELGYTNVYVHVGDGTLGWAEAAPYDGILVTAAAPRPPEPLLQQLKDGGRLVIPVGAWHVQELQLWERQGDHFSSQDMLPVAFVPLRGQHGWKEEEWAESY